MNTDNFKQGQTDYLSFMGPPEGMAPSIPDYVNSPAKSSLDGKSVTFSLFLSLTNNLITNQNYNLQPYLII